MRDSIDCVFCQVVAGNLTANVVGETESLLAFRDLSPVAPTHVLIVPKSHIADASVLTEEHGELLGAMFALAARIAAEEGLTEGYRLVFNVGEAAGNTVAHLHLHVIGGRKTTWPPG